MSRKPVVSRTVTYTEVSCLLRILPEGKPVEEEMVLVGEVPDKRTAYRKIHRMLPDNKKLIRIKNLMTKTEHLFIPLAQFIEVCKENQKAEDNYGI